MSGNVMDVLGIISIKSCCYISGHCGVVVPLTRLFLLAKKKRSTLDSSSLSPKECYSVGQIR